MKKTITLLSLVLAHSLVIAQSAQPKAEWLLDSVQYYHDYDSTWQLNSRTYYSYDAYGNQLMMSNISNNVNLHTNIFTYDEYGNLLSSKTYNSTRKAPISGKKLSPPTAHIPKYRSNDKTYMPPENRDTYINYLKSINDSLQYQKTNEYDSLQRLIMQESITQNNYSKTVLEYDAWGNNSRKIKYKDRDKPPSSQVMYEYNAQGLIIKSRSGLYTTDTSLWEPAQIQYFVYDDLNRLISTTTTSIHQPKPHTVNYVYNPQNQQLVGYYVNAGTAAEELVISHIFDDRGNMVFQRERIANDYYQYKYDEQNREIEKVYFERGKEVSKTTTQYQQQGEVLIATKMYEPTPPKITANNNTASPQTSMSNKSPQTSMRNERLDYFEKVRRSHMRKSTHFYSLHALAQYPQKATAPNNTLQEHNPPDTADEVWDNDPDAPDNHLTITQARSKAFITTPNCLLPNPYRIGTPIHCEQWDKNENYQVSIYALNGTLLHRTTWRGNKNEHSLNIPLAQGIYLIHLEGDAGYNSKEKIIITP